MKECIILAGGFGTRLQSVVHDIPKCMAEVAGAPFLQYILDYLQKEKVDHVILSLGHKAEVVVDWLNDKSWSFDISTITEEKALGTGGAIKFAISKLKSSNTFILNGDTFFNINFDKMLSLHQQSGADISIALKPMHDFDRYGSVEINNKSKITQFNEKVFTEYGLINGGIYYLSKDIFSAMSLPDTFSFEKEILEKSITNLNIFGYPFDNYFIDIGIPTDFQKANIDFKNERFE